MEYRIDCSCGESLVVAETAAGTTTRCRCGQPIAIPSLRELRRLAGIPAPDLSPTLEVEALLQANKLPEEDHCLMCGTATLAVVRCTTECERALVEHDRPSRWLYLLGWLTFGFFGVLGVAIARSRPGPSQEWGKDRIYHLPLRICEACQQRLTTPAEIKQAMCRVPLYQRLLRKYPNAIVALEGPAPPPRT